MGTPQTLTNSGAAGSYFYVTGGTPSVGGLVLQDNNANSTLTFANPINNNGATISLAQQASSASTSTQATMTGVLSGSGGYLKTGAGLLVLSNAANSYTGATTINTGVLSVSTLANGGSNSGIGASSNLAGNHVISGADSNIRAALFRRTVFHHRHDHRQCDSHPGRLGNWRTDYRWRTAPT